MGLTQVHIAAVCGFAPSRSLRTEAPKLRERVIHDFSKIPFGNPSPGVFEVGLSPVIGGSWIRRQRSIETVLGKLHLAIAGTLSIDDSLFEEDLQVQLQWSWQLAPSRSRWASVVSVLIVDNGEKVILSRGVTSRIPLFYRVRAVGLYWATNPAWLLGQPNLEDLNVDGVWHAIRGGDEAKHFEGSLFKDIYRLPAGSRLTYVNDNVDTEVFDELRWQERRLHSAPKDPKEAADELRLRIRNAIRRNIPSNTKHSVSLSGGLDSAIVALETKSLNEVSALTFTTEEFPQWSRHHLRAQELAGWLGIDHDEVIVDECFKRWERLIDPVASLRIPPPYYSLTAIKELGLESLVKREAEVLICGTTVDWLFSEHEYDWILAAGLQIFNPFRMGVPFWKISRSEWKTWFSYHSRLLSRILSSTHFDNSQDSFPSWLTNLNHEPSESARSISFSSDGNRDLHRRQVVGQVERPTFLAEAYGVWQPAGIARIDPLLDLDLIEFALSLPPRYRCNSWQGISVTKPLVRFAYKEHLPPWVISRNYQASEINLIHLFVRRQAHRLISVLDASSSLARLELIHPKGLGNIIENGAAMSSAEAVQLIRACLIEEWLNNNVG